MTEQKMERPNWLVFAAILMFLVAAFTLVKAVSTFTDASWLSELKNEFGSQLWISGIIDLVIAAGCVYAGIALLQGKKFGFYFAVTFALLNAVLWFFFGFWYPVMGIVSIAIDVLILWALAKSYYYFDDYARAGIPE